MSYNIKFDDTSDTVNNWDNRKERVINLIAFYEPDFIGTQEAQLHQLQDMKKGLNKYEWIGVGRADGRSEGEFSAIYYNTERFRLVQNSDSTIWLSESPSTPSKSWDAALPRILTWGTFQEVESGKEIMVYNTHFDHIGDTARAKSAKLIVETVNSQSEDKPVVLTGDFNAIEGSIPYENLTAPTKGLKDAYYETELPHVGPLFTYDDFKVLGENERHRIDYIFVNDKVTVMRHAAISDFRDGRYPSDHLPVITDVRFK
ncbi:endonuclease/exonuclease/phosphatase family protein [Halalkalibaculum roseum]|nr:endonuclease/exonuclease/phosphatase family protein [Halalkalibaculum roseum]